MLMKIYISVCEKPDQDNQKIIDRVKENEPHIESMQLYKIKLFHL